MRENDFIFWWSILVYTKGIYNTMRTPRTLGKMKRHKGNEKTWNINLQSNLLLAWFPTNT